MIRKINSRFVLVVLGFVILAGCWHFKIFWKPNSETRLDQEIQKGVKQFKSARMGTARLPIKLKSLALSGDPVSIGILLALSEESYQELAVLDALGQVRKKELQPKVLDHLRRKIQNGAAPVAAVALKSYSQLMGKDSVSELQKNIRVHWARMDGGGEMVCKAAVEGLERMDTMDSQTALIAQLERVGEPGWLPDYGSTVVASLAKKKTPEARAAIMRYADGLAQKMPPPNDPNGRKYIEKKIAEARGFAGGKTPSENSLKREISRR